MIKDWTPKIINVMSDGKKIDDISQVTISTESRYYQILADIVKNKKTA